MKTRFAFIGLLLAAGAAPALAQGVSAGIAANPTNTGSRDLVVQGDAQPACVMRTPTILSSNNAHVAVRDAGAVDIQLNPDSFIDRATGVPRAVSITLGLPVTCNTAHHITIQSTRGGLSNRTVEAQPAAAAAGSFRSHLDFSVEFDWAGTVKHFDTAQSRSLQILINNAATGVASLHVSIPGGGTPLIAGDYNDTITVKVEVAS